MSNNYEWTFTTGSGAVVTPPSTQSTSGIESITTNIIGDTATSTTTFSVSSIDPDEAEYGVAISENPYSGEVITVTFSDAIDSTTVTADRITLKSETATGDDVTFTATGTLDYVAVVSGNTITITLDPGQLYQNNIVILTLDSLIADTDGNTLGTDYTSYFSTPYSPLYSSMRRIQLDIGPFITDVDEETIMLAILDASVYADSINFTNSIENTTFYYRARWEYTTCHAEHTLIRAMLGDTGLSDRLTKKLGDLEVSRGGAVGLNDMLADLKDCMLEWEVVLQSGGALTPNTSVKPVYGVKGQYAEDAIVVGRQWEPTSGSQTTNFHSAGNIGRYASGRRNLKTYRRRTSFRGKNYD
jgi:hypothetical protein